MATSQDKPIRLYIDYISQPSRAVLALCKLNNIPCEIVEIRVLKNKHKTMEYISVNPLKKVPALEEGGFYLSESHAIMRYICNSWNVSSNWYPKDDPRRRALIDVYLDWHHINTRRCASYIVSQQYPNVDFVKELRLETETEKKAVFSTLKTVEETFLRSTKFLCGEEMTIADLSACCEIMQLKMIEFDFSIYPILNQWLDRCMDNKVMQDVHKVLFKIIIQYKIPKL